MIDDKLGNHLVDRGYQRVSSNVHGIYFFYKVHDGEADVISVIHALLGDEFTLEQYIAILQQIKVSFAHRGIVFQNLLSLIYTKAPEKAKILCNTDEDTHWIIDLNAYQLIIYETQSSDFMNLRGEIERILEEERYSEYAQFLKDSQDLELEEAFYGKDHNQRDPEHKIRWISPLNTLMIAIIIVSFIIQHYSGLFGGENRMLIEGSLSWISIREDKEYYRLLTSMFMHSDWNHLINNMLVLFFVGDNLERAAGRVRYLLIYFGSGMIAGIASFSYNMIRDKLVFSIGASGAIFGIVGAMLYILIVNKGHLEDISSRQIILFAAFSLYGGITNAEIDQAAHIGGFVSGLLLAILLYRKPRRSINFCNRQKARDLE